MEALTQLRRNRALWTGFLLTVLAVLANVLVFLVAVPGEPAILWLGLFLSIAGLALLLAGVKRAFAQPQIYRGKISGTILTVVSLLLFVLGAFGFYHARDLPGSAGAPKVGQRVPEFSLVDKGGKPVSLSQLLSSPLANGAHPKAVLLVFYRGYW
jgi:hypothetical protein